MLSEIRNFEYDLYKVIERYTNKYLNIEENYGLFKLMNSVSGLNKNNSISDLHGEVNRILENTNKKLVIFIDDLDRLEVDEVKEVLKLIRITANFHNTFFVVAYDRDYLTNATKKFTEFENNSFLEKIFQLEVSLPYSSSFLLIEKLNKNLKEIFSSEYHEEINKELLGEGRFTKTFLSEWIENMRDVSRLTNSLSLNLKSILGEVVFSDFLNVELLRIKYPNVYRAISIKPEYFLKAHSFNGGKYRYGLKLNNGSGVIDSYQSSIEHSKMFVYLTDEKTHFGLTERDITKIVNLMKLIFHDGDLFSSNRNSHLSVINPSKYFRYFSYNLSADKLSEVEFNKLRGGEFNVFKKSIKKWVEDGLENELHLKFREVKKFDDFDDFQNVINAMFYLGRLASIKKNQSIIGVDPEDLKRKIDSFSRHKKQDSDYNLIVVAFLKSLFEKEKESYEIESSILSYWRSQLFGEYFYSIDRMEELLLNYLHMYCESNSKLDGTLWNYLFNCSVTKFVGPDSRSYNDSKSYLPKSIEIFKKFVAEKDLDGFIVKIIAYNIRGGNKYCVQSEIIKIFSSWNDFYVWIHSLNNSHSVFIAEFKQFLEKFKETEYKNYIEFDFEKIPVKSKE